MKGLSLLMALVWVLPLFTLAEAEPPARVYALVVKDTVNPYMRKMYEGFVDACNELGCEAVLAGAEEADPRAQARIVEALVKQGVAALAVAANDESVTAPLFQALESGIKVVSVDSAVDPPSRMTHIQQADPQVLSRAMVQAAHRMCSGTGQIAILSTTEKMPNQSAWVRLMRQEFEGNPALYSGMELVEIAYGNDEDEKSREETERLLDTYPDLKVLIAPTSVGLNAAASVIQQRGSSVLATGLGLPSDLMPYIQSGVCPWMYLWNPVDMGYLTAYALNALEQGQITGAVDQTFSAGRLGEKIITASLDGGTEIVVGNPYKFDSGNILSWMNAF